MVIESLSSPFPGWVVSFLRFLWEWPHLCPACKGGSWRWTASLRYPKIRKMSVLRYADKTMCSYILLYHICNITVILQDTKTWFVCTTTGTVQNHNPPSKTSAELHREADGAFKAASREIWWWKFWVLSKKLGILPIPIMVSTEGVHKMSTYYRLTILL